MTLQYIALAALSRIAYGITARGAEQSESLLLSSNGISQRIAVVAVIFTYPKFRIAYGTPVTLSLVDCVPPSVAERLPFRSQ